MSRTHRVGPWVLAVAVVAAAAGCRPDTGSCPGCYEARVVALFDPTQGVMPMPNDLVRAGGKVQIPTTLMLATGTEVRLHTPAMEEFVTGYLNTLDGFLPETPLTFEFYSPTPDTRHVNPATIGPDSFKVFDVTDLVRALATEGAETPEFSADSEVTGLAFAGDVTEVQSATGTRLARMTVTPPAPWTPGHTYAAFLLTTAQDDADEPAAVVPSLTFNFLKSKDPLVKPSEKPDDPLPVSLIPADDKTAAQLEQARLGLQPIFDWFETEVPDKVQIPRSRVALAWTFTVTTASEFAFDPEAGDIPTPNDLLMQQLHDAAGLAALIPAGADCADPTTIDALDTSVQIQAAFFCWLASLDGFSATSVAAARFTRPLDAASVTPEHVRLVDVTGAQAQEVAGAVVRSVKGGLGVQVSPPAVLQPGHRYAVVLFDGLAGKDGDETYAVTPAPAMAMLRLEKPLYGVKTDADGQPLLDDQGQPVLGSMLPDLLDDAQAAQFEAVRAGFAPLFGILDGLGIPKDQVVGLFTFTVSSAAEALFDPNASVIPFPNEVLFKDVNHPEQGLNLPVSPDDPPALQAVLAGLNALDGFSTVGSLATGFSRPLDPASLKLTQDAVFADLSDAMTRFPALLKDASVGVADITEVDTNNPLTLASIRVLGPEALDVAAQGGRLVLTPRSGRPLEPGRRYMVVLFKRLKAVVTPQGAEPPIIVSPTFFLARSKYPLSRTVECPAGTAEGTVCTASNLPQVLSDPDAALLETLRRGYEPIFSAFAMLGIPREDVVLFFTFRTLTVAEELQSLMDDLSTPQAKPLLWGGELKPVAHADVQAVFAGFSKEGIARACVDCAIIARVLLADPDVTDPKNPVMGHFQTNEDGSPKFRKDLKLPFLFVLPEGTGPFPVVVFQHGLAGTRQDLVKAASDLARAGLAAIAVDAPLHGDHPVRIAGTPSGTGFFTADVFAVRDNLREAVLDQWQVTRFAREVLGGFVSDQLGLAPGDPPVIDVDRVTYLGESLGGIIGAVSAAVNQDLDRVALVVPGGHLMRIFADTPNEEFRKPLQDALAALGIEPGSAAYTQFIEFAQWGLDRADPVNFGRLAALPGVPAAERFLVIEARGDDFIPNSTTEELAAALSLADDSTVTPTVFPQGGGTLCHGFFLTGCPAAKYPDLDQGMVSQAQAQARAAVVDFLKAQ